MNPVVLLPLVNLALDLVERALAIFEEHRGENGGLDAAERAALQARTAEMIARADRILGGT